MLNRRTDLAIEAHSLWRESAAETTKLKGVISRDESINGLPVTTVEILDDDGARALGKARGKYITVEIAGLQNNSAELFPRAVEAIAAKLAALYPLNDNDSVLVIGLGNRHITSDAIGPKTVEHTMVTRHLVDQVPEYFGSFRRVSALSPGVLGITGVESFDIILGLCNQIHPALILVVDALASLKLSRLCSTIQLTDTGIVPGSGVGNARAAITKEALGIPVIALGVPTVVEAATLAHDLITESGGEGFDSDILRPYGGTLVVTPKDIDHKVSDISKVLGYAINMSMHATLSVEDIASFLS